MSEDDSEYLLLQEADEPKRQYDIRSVTKKRQQAYKALLQLLDYDLNIYDLARALSDVLAPQAKATSKVADRRALKIKGEITHPDIEGMPVQPTPEISEPKRQDLTDVIADSIREEFAEPTAATLMQAAWRLAGNTHKLFAGSPVPPWDPECQGDEWCLSRVVEVKDFMFNSGEIGFEMRTFFYSGWPAGYEISRYFKEGFERRIAECFGVPWKSAKLMYPQELVQFLGHVRLEPRAGQDLPYFRQIIATASQVKHNRSLLQQRLDLSRCPYGIKSPVAPCMNCSIPYESKRGRKTCTLAVIRE